MTPPGCGSSAAKAAGPVLHREEERGPLCRLPQSGRDLHHRAGGAGLSDWVCGPGTSGPSDVGAGGRPSCRNQLVGPNTALEPHPYPRGPWQVMGWSLWTAHAAGVPAAALPSWLG